MKTMYLTRAKGQLLALSFMSNDPAEIETFKQLCYTRLPRSVSWFHQGNQPEWQMFEFWSDKDNQILDYSMEISDEMGIPLELEDPTIDWVRAFSEETQKKFA